MDIYPRYPKRIALNAISAEFSIPVDNLRLRNKLAYVAAKHVAGVAQ
jgi:hypothetical protein